MDSGGAIHFHVGAHKTATTYIQSCLRANQDYLQAQGIRFVDLWERCEDTSAYRDSLRLAVEGDAVDGEKLREASGRLRALVDERVGGDPPDGPLILSFENALGDYDLSRGGIYPRADIALTHIFNAFPDARIKIFFSFRCFDRFLESGYMQRVYSRLETRTFKQYLADVDVDAMHWMSVIRALESVAGTSSLVAWDYDDFFPGEGKVWSALLGRDDWEAILFEPAARVNPSLSKRGLRYMRRINKFVAPEDAPRFRRFVKRNFGVQTGRKLPTLLEPDMRERLITQYEREQAIIRGHLPLLM